MDTDDKRREAEQAFDDVLRAKIAASRPALTDLLDRAEAEPGEPREEEKPERER